MIFTLEAQMRNTQKKSDLTQLRAQGIVPAVLYGPNMETMSISINLAEFMRCYKKSFTELTFYEIHMDGKKYHTLLKDKLIHPVRRDFLHLDFQVIPTEVEMEFELPVNYIGEAAGVKEGGFVDIIQRTVKVVCQATNLPDNITVDLSPLNVGDAVRIKDLIQGEWVYKDDEEEVLVVVHAQVEEEEEEEESEEGLEEGAEAEATGEAEEKTEE